MTDGNGNGHGNGNGNGTKEEYTDPLAQRLQAISKVGAVALVAGLAAFLIHVFHQTLLSGDTTLGQHLGQINEILLECVKQKGVEE